VSKFLQIALGILAAIGGFVDIGDLVFTTQAGAAFGYEILWAVVIGVIGIVVYAEMSGRVAAVTQRPVFGVVRQRLGFGIGLTTLIAAEVLSLLTLAAEVGGVAVVLRLLFNLPYHLLVPLGIGGLILIVWRLRFEWIERIFGYLGLCLLVFVVAAVNLHPDWSEVGKGFIPSINGGQTVLYCYFVVGVLAAALMPYEVYFYSSGAIEERWTKSDLKLNRINAILGFGLGGTLAVGLIMTSAQVFHPVGADPEFLGTAALGAGVSLGQAGLLLAMVGMLFAIGGAAIDTALAGAYNIAQFLGWEWGKYRRPSGAPRFTLAWLVMFGLALVIVSTGVDPVLVTEYSVVLSVVALPFTYLPVLLVARDRSFMGEHANGRIATTLGWAYLALMVVVALAAIPLMLATNGGTPS
jgi:Mn2+/Fe2+ NRAMP family transporter